MSARDANLAVTAFQAEFLSVLCWMLAQHLYGLPETLGLLRAFVGRKALHSGLTTSDDRSVQESGRPTTRWSRPGQPGS